MDGPMSREELFGILRACSRLLSSENPTSGARIACVARINEAFGREQRREWVAGSEKYRDGVWGEGE